jgi:hypothetical protein
MIMMHNHMIVLRRKARDYDNVYSYFKFSSSERDQPTIPGHKDAGFLYSVMS